MPKKGVILVDQPVWEDNFAPGDLLPQPRFPILMQYMAWIIQKIIDEARMRGYKVYVLHGEECTRENIIKNLIEKDPIAVVHGSHGACNALAGAPYKPLPTRGQLPSTALCVMPKGWCWTRDPFHVPNGAVDCDKEYGPMSIGELGVFDGRLIYIIACLAQRWLGEDMATAGASCILGYNDLLELKLGGTPEDYWIEELYRDVWVSGFLALLAGATSGEARDVIIAAYEEAERWVEENKPEWRWEIVPSLEANKQVFLMRGDPNVTIKPEVAPPQVPPPESIIEVLLYAGLILMFGVLGWMLIEKF